MWACAMSPEGRSCRSAMAGFSLLFPIPARSDTREVASHGIAIPARAIYMSRGTLTEDL
jgi:hypothetical protein